MAVIDEARGVLVVRIVYDGPALSGKTTSLKALARGVASQVTTPAENAGRTLFFDWVDYVGGLFDGRQIRCQIVSVPGQRDLAERRRLLLGTADAIVLVLDTRAPEWDFSLGWVKETVPFCRGQSPPVGLVLQANKRDAPDAVPSDTLREALTRVGTMAVVPSTATSGDGIREAFVLAVRLALDRVRALASAGQLPIGAPPEDDPEQLLERMRRAEREAGAADGPKPQLLGGTLESELDRIELTSSRPPPAVEGEDGEIPFVPDPGMPGGMIWPPVDGRILLHEAATLGIRPRRTSRADWSGSGSGFRFHSTNDAVFPDLQSARNELIEWARLHSANTAHISGGRAVILAEAGHGRLRLWQIVRSEATLRERLATALLLSDPALVARELLAVASQLAAAREYFSTTTVDLPCTLWTVGAHQSARPMFVGLMPTRGSHVTAEPDVRELIWRELSPQLRELRRSRVDYSHVVTLVTSFTTSAGSGTPGRYLSELVDAT